MSNPTSKQRNETDVIREEAEACIESIEHTGEALLQKGDLIWLRMLLAERNADETSVDPDDAPDVTEKFAELVRDAQAWRALQAETSPHIEKVSAAQHDVFAKAIAALGKLDELETGGAPETPVHGENVTAKCREIELAKDRMTYGTSYVRIDADGRITRIDPSTVMIAEQPEQVKTNGEPT